MLHRYGGDRWGLFGVQALLDHLQHGHRRSADESGEQTQSHLGGEPTHSHGTRPPYAHCAPRRAATPRSAATGRAHTAYSMPRMLRRAAACPRFTLSARCRASRSNVWLSSTMTPVVMVGL